MSNKKSRDEPLYIAWWNLENLFDVEDSPRRADWLQRNLRSELRGWTQEKLDLKVRQLASVIRQMNEGRGPDLLGVCESENGHVLRLLTEAIDSADRTYVVVHEESQDKRGIDVAFIYDSRRLTAGKQFSHRVVKRSPTRAIFQVTFTTSNGQEFVILGNHWPARSAGQYDSEPFRIAAAETLAYWHEQILRATRPDMPIVVVGDFNDDPTDRSIRDYALGALSRERVMNSRIPRLLNLMPAWGGGGTYWFGSEGRTFDQILVSKHLLREGSPMRVDVESAEIICFEEMAYGRYKRPRQYGKGEKIDPRGFSDHYPVGVVVHERI